MAMTEKTVALYLSERELERRGWTGHGLTREQALMLARERIGGRVVGVELFAARMGVLLIVRQRLFRPMAERPLRRGRVRRYL